MKFFLPVIFAAFVSTNSFAATVQEVSPQRGRPIAQIKWTDDAGHVRRLSEFAGFPVVLLPIYTRCRTACIANVDQLKKALADSSADPRQFRVLLFSFDSAETPSTLARYRTRENIPLGWSVGTASQPDIDALLESIGFQYGKAGTEFVASKPFDLSRFEPAHREMDLWDGLLGSRCRSCIENRSPARATGSANIPNGFTRYCSLLGSLLCVALAYYTATASPCATSKPPAEHLT